MVAKVRSASPGDPTEEWRVRPEGASEWSEEGLVYIAKVWNHSGAWSNMDLERVRKEMNGSENILPRRRRRLEWRLTCA